MNNGSRVTGSLSTVLEKYKNLAKDATSSGDYVGAENYMQHAEHYSRMINDRNARNNNNSNGSSNGSSVKVSENDKSIVASEVNEVDADNNDENSLTVTSQSKGGISNNNKNKKSLN